MKTRISPRTRTWILWGSIAAVAAIAGTMVLLAIRFDRASIPCEPSSLAWRGAPPRDQIGLQAACDWFPEGQERAAHLMRGVVVEIRPHRGDPAWCRGARDFDHNPCTIRKAAGNYLVEYDLQDPDSLRHEMTHVLLFQAGMPAAEHHQYMKKHGIY